MKTTKYILSMLLLMVFVMNAKAQRDNRLTIEDIVVEPGVTAQLPVVVTNTDDVVAVEFDLTLPETFTMEQTTGQTNRMDEHQTTIRNMGNNTYKVMLYSPSNKPIRGSNGILIKLNVNIPIDLEEGSEHALAISNAVLGIATGENVLTEANVGKIRVSRMPDLTVKNIMAGKTSFNPGERIMVSWQVENLGELATEDGWSEQVSLVSEDGAESKLIATTYYYQTLGAKSVVSRNAEVQLPALLGVEGQMKLQVRIIPFDNTKEPENARENNTSQSESIYNINKVLTFELSPSRFIENEVTRVSARLNRSGRWNEEQTFKVVFTNDARISIPTTVTIPAGQSAVVFYLSITDNNVLDNDSIINISIDGNGYEAVTGQLVIEDNEFPNLSVTASKTVVNEGETFQLTITTSRASAQPIMVTLMSENSKRSTFPSQVTIPANETSVTVDVVASDNDIPDVELSNMFTVSAPRHNNGEALILLQDNDMPVLQLTLTPDKVSESAGPVSVSGVLRRLTNQDKKITVKLTDNSNGGIYYANSTIEMAKGVDEVHFNLGPIDNSVVDGDRIYTVTAAVYIASCSCNATGESAGAVNAQLEVYDNDGPTLSLASTASTVKEGGTIKLTITRNTPITAAMNINLSSDNDEFLAYNHSLVIPAGSSSVSVDVKVASNDLQNDSKIIVFTAEAEGMSSGTCYLNVTDQTKPDARISIISTDKETVAVGGNVTLAIEIVNEGLDVLPQDVAIKIYHKGESRSVATVYTNHALAVGEKENLTIPITLPSNVGKHSYYTVVNENNAVDELSFTNNTSAEITILVTSPYTATVNTNKNVYSQGDQILISGQLSGEGIANTDVEVYVINDGTRQTKTVTTDAQGAFSTDWQLYPLQSGHFTMGACYPNEGKKDALTSFDVYGLKRKGSGYITCDVTLGETYTGNIEFVNPGVLDLTNAKVEVLSKPDNCIVDMDFPTTINGSETVQLVYSLTGTSATLENKWDEIKARITTAEGISTDVILYFYCRNAKAKLVANVQELVTTMTKGKSREYSIQVTNIGKGNTGMISLALPEWMKSLSGNTLASLNQNDTATVALQFIPTEDMQLNVPVTGQFGINCENGDGTFVNFSITPVSEENGTLTVDVMDEYTYYTTEAPHVEGAQVVVRNPITKALVAQGLTGTDGKLSLELTEGYYNLYVTADNHDTYSNNIYVDPGMETLKEINLSVQGIKVDWKVEETEIEDEYEIVTTVTYETNVPAPIVVVDLPSRIDGEILKEGESLVFNATLTNKGLINAEDAQLVFQERTGDFLWEPLAQNHGLIIAPQQSIVIPIKLTRLSHSSAGVRPRKANSTDDGCVQGMIISYRWKCGSDHKWHPYEVQIPYKSCPSKPNNRNEFGWPGIGWSGIGWLNISWPGGGSPNAPNQDKNIVYKPTTNNDKPSSNEELYDCDPCLHKKIPALRDCIIGFIPVVGNPYGCIKGNYDCAKGALEGDTSWRQNANCFLTGVTCAMITCEAVTWGLCKIPGWIPQIGSCLVNLTVPCDDNDATGGGSSKIKQTARSSEPNYVTQMRSIASIALKEVSGYMDALLEFYGDSVWINNTNLSEMETVLMSIINSQDGYLDADKIRKYKPNLITNAQFDRFVERLNNTSLYEQYGGELDNMIHADIIKHAYEQIEEAENQALALGYEDVSEMWQIEAKAFLDKIEEKSSSVCASITLQFSQSMVMTRQAFRGTLTVFNGHETDAMTDVKLTLNVSSKDGKIATSHEFQINPETLNGFNGELDLTNGWSLAAGETGSATILFIPTKYAAPSEPVDYSFGGTLSYIDPFTGLEVRRELYPVTLTVKPSPELDLDYFLQRDIYGDDPLTDEVEPMQPAEFALLINNKGYGDATNVKMTTKQPEIIDNEKGLLVDFEILSSQVNGKEANLAFVQTIANDFGTIEAKKQAYAQWWLQSSLLGHFTEYNVKANHLTSSGNEYLSLLDQVNIHELIHGFTPTVGGRGFLVNDIIDAEDLPDMIYFTDATQENVSIAANATITQQGDDYLLTVIPSQAGWNYGSLIDPTNSKQQIMSITRMSDGTEIPLDNVWRTNRTLRDGKDPIIENRLHFIGNILSESDSYLLSFSPREEVSNIVTGHITAESDNNQPIVGATITLRSGDIVYTTTTDGSGNFTLNVDDTSLDYVMTCTAEGFISGHEKNVRFLGEAVKCDYTLMPGATIKIPASGICTYSSVIGLDFSQASMPIKAYYGKRYDTERVIIDELSIAAANEGLVLMGQPNMNVDVPAATNASPLTDNVLTGTAFAPYTVMTDDVYVLANKTGKAKFHQAARGLTIPKHKAYLILYIGEAGAKGIDIIFDEATLIEMVKDAENDKEHFGINGIRINETMKGLHIVKGKKVIVKH